MSRDEKLRMQQNRVAARKGRASLAASGGRLMRLSRLSGGVGAAAREDRLSDASSQGESSQEEGSDAEGSVADSPRSPRSPLSPRSPPPSPPDSAAPCCAKSSASLCVPATFFIPRRP